MISFHTGSSLSGHHLLFWEQHCIIVIVLFLCIDFFLNIHTDRHPPTSLVETKIAPSITLLPLIIANGSYNTQNEGPTRPQAVALTLQDLQDTLELFLPDVCVQHVGQLLQGVQQQKLQPLRDQEKGDGDQLTCQVFYS